MARKLGKTKRGLEPPLRYGTAIVRVRWPYLATENLEVTVEYKGCRMLLQVKSIDFESGAETIKGTERVQ